MKTLLIAACLLISFQSIASDLSSIAPGAQGDSISEVLADMNSLEECQDAIDSMNIDSENDADLYENAHDQCSNTEYDNN